MVSSLQYCGDQKDQRVTTRISGGGEETLLSEIKPCGMEIPPSEALDTSKSRHLTMGYLLRDEHGDLEFQSLLAKIMG